MAPACWLRWRKQCNTKHITGAEALSTGCMCQLFGMCPSTCEWCSSKARWTVMAPSLAIPSVARGGASHPLIRDTESHSAPKQATESESTFCQDPRVIPTYVKAHETPPYMMQPLSLSPASTLHHSANWGPALAFFTWPVPPPHVASPTLSRGHSTTSPGHPTSSPSCPTLSAGCPTPSPGWPQLQCYSQRRSPHHLILLSSPPHSYPYLKFNFVFVFLFSDLTLLAASTTTVFACLLVIILPEPRVTLFINF